VSVRSSPLKQASLRVPGQSLQGQIDRLSGDVIATYSAYAAGAFALMLYEWARWLTKSSPNPLVVTILGAGVIAYSLRRLLKAKRHLRLLEMGRDGERAVAEALDKIRGKGAAVLHDIVAQGFNIDHVVIAKRGIYAIETKTWTKRNGAQLTYDGSKLLIGGWKPPSDPVSQAVANAAWLSRNLKEMTGKRYYVRPVVVFPGWYVNNPGGASRPGAWVLNPEQLLPIITDQPPSLSDKEAHSASYFLTRYVKTHLEPA